ncbi:acyltransferase [Romboutsia weinsteinii]|uniref:Acyltransferase n=1 Tax=Romboutsia weinsteinii TaxID=2020949 RepID=A0A371J3T2_9FIRM|nr:acyltransferase [Romboutsia weinsteinii]RDY27440.1 acyltransferase [Romboutsia weinsteinii]
MTKNNIKEAIFNTLIKMKIDKILGLFINLPSNIKNYNLSKQFNQCKFVGNNVITDISKFKIGEHSCLKDSYIESSGGVDIGSYVHGAINLVIWSSNHIYDSEMIPFNYKYNYKKVIIKDFVWLGEGVKILPGVTIGEGAIVGMGAVVTKDIPDYAIVAGNPAKIVKYRDIEKFKKNKNEDKFRYL